MKKATGKSTKKMQMGGVMGSSSARPCPPYCAKDNSKAVKRELKRIKKGRRCRKGPNGETICD